jgi:hypothetical protein
VPFLRPGLHDLAASRGAAVQTGQRPPPEAARSGLDGCEHGATLDQVGPAAASLSFPRCVGGRNLTFENLVSHPAKDLTAGRKSNAHRRSPDHAQTTNAMPAFIRRATNRPFGVNIIARFSTSEQIDVLVEQRVRVVVFFWDARREARACTLR